MMLRNIFDVKGRTLSYLDYKVYGSPLVALRGHFGSPSMFSGFVDCFPIS